MTQPTASTSQHGTALRLTDIEIRYPGSMEGEAVVVDRLSMKIDRGESVGILGESGSGKTSLALAATGLLPRSARSTGHVELAGRQVPTGADERFWRRVRGNTVGVVYQQPSLALHPLRRAGAQIMDVVRSHRPWPRARCRARALELLADLDLDPQTFHAFPHQLSGGQRQRVVLAQALACEPALLIADEPTTALDRDTEARVLQLVDRLRRRAGMSMLWISHDPEVLAEITDRVYVMYAGKWMEQGPTLLVLEEPLHPYTQALLACRPTGVGSTTSLIQRRLPVIWGETPSVRPPPPGCRFAERCDRVLELCAQSPEPVTASERQVWCFGASTEKGASWV